MNPLTSGELERLLADLESDRVERKETFRGDAPTAVREAVCAFANDLPGHCLPGVVFLGASDDGRPTGLAITDELLRNLGEVKADGNIVPPPTLTVEKRSLHGADVAVLTVAPSDSPPVRYKGRVYIRVGPRKAIASAQDERILNERRRHWDRPFDVRPIHGASVEDLDVRRFEVEYLPNAVAPDVLERNERTLEQRLAATKMVASADEPVPTVLGVLVLGKSPRDYVPGAWVQFLRIQGTALVDPIIDEQAIDGPILDVARRLEEKLVSHNRTSVEISNGFAEERHSIYPLVALQQLTRNALLHRSYESTNAPIHVYWYDDRLEVQSPGGPFGEVTRENFGTPGLADYRNPSLAEAMRVLGLVQRYGFGIALARRELEKNGNPEPEFVVTPERVLVVVRPSP